MYALGFIYLFLFKRTVTPEWKQWYLSNILGFVFFDNVVAMYKHLDYLSTFRKKYLKSCWNWVWNSVDWLCKIISHPSALEMLKRTEKTRLISSSFWKKIRKEKDQREVSTSLGVWTEPRNWHQNLGSAGNTERLWSPACCAMEVSSAHLHAFWRTEDRVALGLPIY